MSDELFRAIDVLKARSNPENWDYVLRVQRAAHAMQNEIEELRKSRDAYKHDAEALLRIVKAAQQ